jgi:hypothetical protein
MIHDVALRWVVTLLFGFSAAVCVRAAVVHRDSLSTVVSHALHALMALAMAVMAWPAGAALPPRAPMFVFATAAVWFVVAAFRTTRHRMGDTYHAVMMAAMTWMYAAMGGVPLGQSESSERAATAAMAMPGMPDMPDMPGIPGMSTGSVPVGQGSGGSGADGAIWITALNWLCAIGFAVAAAFWMYRLLASRPQAANDESPRRAAVLGQFAMAAATAVMFAALL